MTSLADRTIAALRARHLELASVVTGLSDDQLESRSGASEWNVAQVLSHLGSGAEITLAGLRASVDGTPRPDDAFNHSVWDRWNGLGAREQADGSLEHDERLVAALEELTAEQRETVAVDVGFLPAPLSLASFAGMRLSELTQHSWDARVAFDPAAILDPDVAEVLVEHLSGGLGFVLGFAGKADALAEPAVVAVQGTDVAIRIDGTVGLETSPAEATATFRGDLEAVVRLVAGRLTPSYTPADVEVTGNVTLDDLRRVFPGY